MTDQTENPKDANYNRALIIVESVQFKHRYPSEAKKANGRIEKAIEIAAAGHVKSPASRNNSHIYMVVSQSDEKYYLVDPIQKSCTCPDASEKHMLCKHRLAVAFSQAFITNPPEWLKQS